MANLLLLFTALSVFSKNTLAEVKKGSTTHEPGTIGAPPPPPPPMAPLAPAAPPAPSSAATPPKKKTEPKKTTVTKPATAAEIGLKKRRIDFLNEMLAVHEKAIADFGEEIVNADIGDISQIEKDVTKLLKTYNEFNDIRDFDFDNKAQIIQQLDNAIKETQQLLKDIKAPKKTITEPETTTPTGTPPPPPPPPMPTSGAVPPPPPPPPALQTGIGKLKTPKEILQEGAATVAKPAPKKEPAKPQPAGINPADITAAKLKTRTQTTASKSASLIEFEKRFDAIKLMPPKLKKSKADALLEDLNLDIKKSAGQDKTQKEQLVATITSSIQ